ncbi:MAG: rRNA maturation RNase YbeY [Ruminococcaceae bacterium]|nr:rRNA maturation RNase YbeY [Oscillospiraceae bacterium]
MANKVYITDAQTKVKVPSGTRLLIRRCCNAVVENENFPYSVEVSVTLIDNEEIKKLNEEYLNKSYPTDVLSFPLYEDGNFDDIPKDIEIVPLGDIVISIEKAVEQAEKFNHSLQREVGYLMVHAMLHLFGYNHEEGGLREVHMREKEETVLKQLGLSRGFNYVLE